MDLLKGVKEYVYPVGRLDYDSEGLLLLTNDGELAARLTHPRHEVDKVYEARVRGVPDAHTLDRLVARRHDRGTPDGAGEAARVGADRQGAAASRRSSRSRSTKDGSGRCGRCSTASATRSSA